MRVLAGDPREPRPTPAVSFYGCLGLLGIWHNQLLNICGAVEVRSLVLKHPGYQAGPFNYNRLSTDVDASSARPSRPASGESQPRQRKAALKIILRMRRTVRHVTDLKNGVNQNATAPRRLSTHLGTIVDE